MIRWLRVVLPRLDYLLIYFAVIAAFGALFFYLEWQLGQRLPQIRQSLRPIIIAFTVGYAIHRVLAFHPAMLPSYRAWLATTPWTSRKALPWPVHLVPQDLVILGIFVALAWPLCGPWSLAVPQVFLLVYLLALATMHFVTGQWGWGYAVGFGLGLAVFLWRDVRLNLAASLLAYAVAYLGLRWSLERFPWEVKTLRDVKMSLPTSQRSGWLGWPFGRLAPKFSDEYLHIPMHHALLISLLVAWWTYTLISLVPEQADRRLLMLYPLMLGIWCVPLIRLAIYADGYWPPISLGGRICTGRWFIHGYDQVFVAPLLAFVVGGMVLIACELLGVELLYGGPSALAVSLLISLGMRPTLKEWRLTGNHRIVEGSRRKEVIKVG